MPQNAAPHRAAAYGCVLFAALLALAFGQTQGPPVTPTFRTGVDVVQVDVSVLDRNRRPVRGLTAQDFTVLEDGKPREIVAFAPVDLPAPAAAPLTTAAAWTRDVAPDLATNDVPREGRLVVIAFDWSIRFQDSQLARKIAIETVNSLSPNDQAAVIYTSGFANAGMPQNFTADRARLLAAINQTMAFAMQGNDVIPPQKGGFINANGVMIDDPQGYSTSDCLCRACALEAITRVADNIRSASGRRKVMVFIGTYFRGFEPAMAGPRGMPRGMPPPPMSGTSFGIPVAAGPGSCSVPLREAREKMELAAGLANLTIHVVDPVGIETSFNSPLGGATMDVMLTRQDSLHLPADLTGGRTIIGTNAPESLVPAIMAESQSYYLIGFSASDRQASNRLRRIEVKVARPNVSTRSRAGYYGNEEASASSASASSSALVQAVEGTMPRKAMPLTLVATPFATPGEATGTVALVLGVQKPHRADLGRSVGSNRAPAGESMRVTIAALDPKGRVVASREEAVGFTLAEGASFEMLSRLTLAPGPYEIRVAAEDGAGERSSVFTFVDVPNFAKERLSLTGVALAVTPGLPSAPPDRLAELTPLTPTARRSFAKTDTATAFVRIHQTGSPASVTVLTRIVDETGRVALEESRQAKFQDQGPSARTADYQVTLPLERLAPGEYLLAIQASTNDHDQKRNVRFTVR